jgi:hypothetical protein
MCELIEWPGYDQADAFRLHTVGGKFRTVGDLDWLAASASVRGHLGLEMQGSSMGLGALGDYAVIYCASAFAALRIGDHRVISDFTKLANLVTERSSFLGSDAPKSASRFFSPGSSNA